jgi:energy-coupling factor transporter transmembrane protein EcfT
VPGSPRPSPTITATTDRRPLHPAALLLTLMLVGAGLATTRSTPLLLLATGVAAGLALRAEGRSLRLEAPLLGLAALVFLAHSLLGPGPRGAAIREGAAIALRLLALVYLLRWAARSFLGRAGRWLLGLNLPRRPRLFILLAESARLATALLPLAVRESEQHATALRARGLRAGRGARGRARYLAAWLLPFLGTMLRVGDAFGDALLARGHALGTVRRGALAADWGLREWGLLVGGAAAGAWMIHG